MTFAEAHLIVCPDGDPVNARSKEFQDILELMRQSGHINFQERLVQENVPVVPKTVDQVRQFTAKATVVPTSVKISKKDWLSVDVNREAFIKHINKK